jgi:plasmid maintenance system killer protein
MEITIKDRRLKAALEDPAMCKRHYGAEMAKKAASRLASLKAADSLADFWPPFSGPERCHELKGDLAGEFSVDLKQPYRLLFVPTEARPKAPDSDDKERWNSITSIDILRIEDTHG